jgi:hypothetical protein
MFVNRILRAAAAVGAITFALGTWASADQGITFRNVKALGMGDTRIAGGLEYNGFVDNPALLSRVDRFRMTIATIPITINKDMSDMAKFVKDNRDRFANFDSLSSTEKDQFIKDIEPYDGKWARVNVSPMVNIAGTFAGQSLGLAVFSVNDVNFKIDRGIYEPRVWGEGVSDIAVFVGYSRPLTFLTPGLKIGANFKYMQRRTANLFQIKASDLGNFSDTMDPILDKAKDNASTHIGVDVGALWTVPLLGADVGAVMKNFGFGPGYTVDFGIAKQLYDNRITLLADYDDFLDKNRENAFKKIHLGGEYDLQFVNFRVGLNSGYPTVGAGLNFKVVQLDAAYFIEELSNAPGVNDDPRYAVQLRIGW